MALIKLQTPISEIRGKLGGVVYSINGNGRFVRPWSMPPKRRTQQQATHRNLFANALTAWRGLTDNQRAAWAALAANPPEPDFDRFGDAVLLTGLQWFTRVFIRLSEVGRATLEDAPTDPRPEPPYTNTMAFDAGIGEDKIYSYGYPAGQITYDIIAFAAQTNGPSVYATPKSFTMIGYEATPLNNQMNLTADYDAQFPLQAAGWKAWLKIYLQDTNGLRAQEVNLDILMTAP